MLAYSPADLHGGTLPAGGAAEQVGDHGAHQHQWAHPSGHSRAGRMDFDQDQIVAGLGVLTGYPVAEDNGQTSASKQSGPLSFAPMSLLTLS